MNILFVCSQNKWRSRTAEKIFKDNGTHLVRSAGTERSARIKLTQKMINWADRIFVMETKHQKKIIHQFDIDRRSVEVLDIPDDYEFMDEELIEILKLKMEDVFTS